MAIKYVVVAGTRSFNNYELMCKILDEFKLTKDDFIISGCAMGADWLGERYAREHGIMLKRFPANWKSYGKQAGYIRNKQMAEVCTHGVVFWNGSSRGSKHMIDLLREYNREYRVVKYSE